MFEPIGDMATGWIWDDVDDEGGRQLRQDGSGWWATAERNKKDQQRICDRHLACTLERPLSTFFEPGHIFYIEKFRCHTTIHKDCKMTLLLSLGGGAGDLTFHLYSLSVNPGKPVYRHTMLISWEELREENRLMFLLKRNAMFLFVCSFF